MLKLQQLRDNSTPLHYFKCFLASHQWLNGQMSTEPGVTRPCPAAHCFIMRVFFFSSLLASPLPQPALTWMRSYTVNSLFLRETACFYQTLPQDVTWLSAVVCSVSLQKIAFSFVCYPADVVCIWTCMARTQSGGSL